MTKCLWICPNGYEYDNVTESECGQSHVFNNGTPTENHFKFCPYCGKEIEDNTNQ